MIPAPVPAQVFALAVASVLASCAVPAARTLPSTVSATSIDKEDSIAVTQAALRHLVAQDIGCVRPEVANVTNASASHGSTWYSQDSSTPRQLADQEAAPIDRAALNAGSTVQYITRVDSAWAPERISVNHPSCGVSIDSPVFAGDYAFLDSSAISSESGNGFLIALRRQSGQWRVIAQRQSLMVVI